MKGDAPFIVPAISTRVIFGNDSVNQLAGVVSERNAARVLLVSSAGRAPLLARLQDVLGNRCIGVDLRAAMHVPADIAARVHADALDNNIDLIVAVGGGSSIGLAKAVALNGGPPFVAIPTTYSGSEMTPIWGITRDGKKTTGRSETVRPAVVLYDPLLSVNLPIRIAVPSALNALAHCVEALYAPDANPVATIAAGEGARAIVHALRAATGQELPGAARSQLLYGSYLAGLALGMVQMGLHHKLCHVLGGSFGMPHAETHAILLPYTYGYNADAAVDHLLPGRRALDADTPVESVLALETLVRTSLREANAPQSLAEIGFPAESAVRAAELATAAPYANPRTVDCESIALMLRRATAGQSVLQ